MKMIIMLGVLGYFGFLSYQKYQQTDSSATAYKNFATHMAFKQYEQAKELATGETLLYLKGLTKSTNNAEKKAGSRSLGNSYKTSMSSEAIQNKQAQISENLAGPISKIDHLIISKTKNGDEVTLIAKQKVFHQNPSKGKEVVWNFQHTVLLKKENGQFRIASFEERRED